MLSHGVSVSARGDTTVLAPGTALTFVSDSTVDGRVAPNSTFRAHLKDRLSSNGVVIAEPGMTVQLVVADKATGADGVTRFTIAFSRFKTLAGDLPVTPAERVVTEIRPGIEFLARTDATVVDDGTHLRVRIPLPFTLSNDTPQGEFTPIPLRTYSPFEGRPRGGRPTPSPVPTASAIPAASPSPSASPGS